MSLRKVLIGSSVSAILFAAGAITHVLAAEDPHDGKRPVAMNVDPAQWHKQMCTDHFARDVGRMAYIETKLSLNDSQRPLFDSWKQTVLGSAKTHEGDCLSHQARMDGEMHGHNIIERESRMQTMLQTRLAELNAEMPSLKALYDSLTPEQKIVFDHGGPMGHHEGHGMRGHGGWHGHGGQGPREEAD